MTYKTTIRATQEIEIHGPGCESFLVHVDESLADRLVTLLDHAYHAGHEHALCKVRAALGLKR